jgi:hypothetical protein
MSAPTPAPAPPPMPGLEHLAGLASLCRGAPPLPCEHRLVETLAALRALVFPQLCPAAHTGASLAEQVAVFHRAECVVGPHGAGLTNLLFCRSGTQVIELGTPYRPWACFYEIAHHRGLDYHLHMASPWHVRHFDPQTGIGDSDLRVDPDGLRNVIESLLTNIANMIGSKLLDQFASMLSVVSMGAEIVNKIYNVVSWTKPTSDPSDSTPPPSHAAITPPMRAKGNVSASSSTRRGDWKSANSSTRMPINEARASQPSRL